MKKLTLEVKLMIVFAIVMLIVGIMEASAATIRWSAVTDGEVLGYNVYWNDGTEQFYAHVGNVTEVEDIEHNFNLVPNTPYTFEVTAYNTFGESPKSTPVTWAWEVSSDYIPPEDYKPAPNVYILGPVNQVIIDQIE